MIFHFFAQTLYGEENLVNRKLGEATYIGVFISLSGLTIIYTILYKVNELWECAEIWPKVSTEEHFRLNRTDYLEAQQ